MLESGEPMSPEHDGPPPAEDAARERVAAALAGISAAVRQRQAERAGRVGSGDELAAKLADLAEREFVEEPRPVSPRPVVGRVLVFVRKAAYHLFFKWHARAVLQQQNEFNQTAGALLAELAERQRALERETARLAARLAEVERSRDGAGE